MLDRCDNCKSLNIQLTTYAEVNITSQRKWPYIWFCNDCSALVGCHQDTYDPLGTMADRTVRDLRIKAHTVFDKLWKTGLLTRELAYKRMSAHLDKDDAHIGSMSRQELLSVIRWAQEEYDEDTVSRRTAKRYARHSSNVEKVNRNIQRRFRTKFKG